MSLCLPGYSLYLAYYKWYFDMHITSAMFIIITHAATLVHTATELKSTETTGSIKPTSSYETCCPKPHSKCMIVLLTYDITLLLLLEMIIWDVYPYINCQPRLIVNMPWYTCAEGI